MEIDGAAQWLVAAWIAFGAVAAGIVSRKGADVPRVVAAFLLGPVGMVGAVTLLGRPDVEREDTPMLKRGAVGVECPRCGAPHAVEPWRAVMVCPDCGYEFRIPGA